jgi:hypothetical protein
MIDAVTAKRRWLEPLAVVATVLLLAFAAFMLWRWWANAIPEYRALDIGHYLDATRRWLETGQPYLANEIAGPYPAYEPLTFLHPPIALLLFLPFLYLPIVSWWVIPLGVTLALVIRWRPPRLVWPILALSLCTDGFRNAVITGNTDMWMLFAMAAGLAWCWPAVVAIIKPTFFPLLLLALRRRSGWVALILVGLACLPFGSLWIDWFNVVRNGPGGLLYSLPNYLWVSAPLLAWYLRARSAAPSTIHTMPLAVRSNPG